MPISASRMASAINNGDGPYFGNGLDRQSSARWDQETPYEFLQRTCRATYGFTAADGFSPLRRTRTPCRARTPACSPQDTWHRECDRR